MTAMAKQQPTYKEAMDAHAREYLERVLKATGGERQAAAEMAGLNRTHLQALIKRYGVNISYDPKARGRRKGSPKIVSEKSEDSASKGAEPTEDCEAPKAEIPNHAIRF